MAAVGVEVGGSWFPPSGVVAFFVALLLLSIFLTALCSMCSRRSFDLRDSEVDKDPSALIKVAKLEEVTEVRENPMISDNLRDEAGDDGKSVSFTPWRSHLGAPQNHQDGQTNGVAAVKNTASHSETAGESTPEEGNSVLFTVWRSHLNPEVNSSTAPDNFYHTIGGGGSSPDADASSVLTNHGPGEEPAYAQVTFPVRTPQEELEEEEASSPPLPHRRTQLEA